MRIKFSDKCIEDVVKQMFTLYQVTNVDKLVENNLTPPQKKTILFLQDVSKKRFK